MYSVSNIGKAYVELGLFKKAINHLVTALAYWEEYDHAKNQILIHLNIARSYKELGELSEALSNVSLALIIAEEASIDDSLMYLEAAEVFNEGDDYENCQQCITNAEKAFAGTGSVFFQLYIDILNGLIDFKQMNFGLAYQTFEMAYEGTKKQNFTFLERKALDGLVKTNIAIFENNPTREAEKQAEKAIQKLQEFTKSHKLSMYQPVLLLARAKFWLVKNNPKEAFLELMKAKDYYGNEGLPVHSMIDEMFKRLSDGQEAYTKLSLDQIKELKLLKEERRIQGFKGINNLIKRGKIDPLVSLEEEFTDILANQLEESIKAAGFGEWLPTGPEPIKEVKEKEDAYPLEEYTKEYVEEYPDEFAKEYVEEVIEEKNEQELTNTILALQKVVEQLTTTSKHYDTSLSASLTERTRLAEQTIEQTIETAVERPIKVDEKKDQLVDTFPVNTEQFDEIRQSLDRMNLLDNKIDEMMRVIKRISTQRAPSVVRGGGGRSTSNIDDAGAPSIRQLGKYERAAGEAPERPPLDSIIDDIIVSWDEDSSEDEGSSDEDTS